MFKKIILFWSLILCFHVKTFANAEILTEGESFTEQIQYAALDNTEAILSFQHFVEINSQVLPNQELVEKTIQAQINHLFGSMSAVSVRYRAVPKNNHEITQVKLSKKSDGLFIVHYSYYGTILILDGPTSKYEIKLPNNPATVYAASFVNGQNLCTDPHYPTENDFWYFWNPDQAGCPLKEGKDFTTIQAQLKRLPNTLRSYPEYERLEDENGNIKVSIFLGMDEPNLSPNPNNSVDVNAETFRKIKKNLLKNNYINKIATLQDLKNHIPLLSNLRNNNLPYVEYFSKKFEIKNETKTILISVFFGPTGIDERSTPFHHLFKEAMSNDSILIYSGHSGLGGHLDLNSIELIENFKMEPNKNKYQIYFFNSCSSYPYYNSLFFERKKTTSDPHGTKNLDVMVNGLATYFSVMYDTNLGLINAVESWITEKEKTSYQQLVQKMDSGNLLGVIGDEDNP